MSPSFLAELQQHVLRQELRREEVLVVQAGERRVLELGRRLHTAMRPFSLKRSDLVDDEGRIKPIEPGDRVDLPGEDPAEPPRRMPGQANRLGELLQLLDGQRHLPIGEPAGKLFHAISYPSQG